MTKVTSVPCPQALPRTNRKPGGVPERTRCLPCGEEAGCERQEPADTRYDLMTLLAGFYLQEAARNLEETTHSKIEMFHYLCRKMGLSSLLPGRSGGHAYPPTRDPRHTPRQ